MPIDLPNFLPASLNYARDLENQGELFAALRKTPQDLVIFFEAACDDESWARENIDFIETIFGTLTEIFFQDKLSMELAARAAKTVHEHYSLLEPVVEKNLNLSFRLKDETVQANSLLYASSSEFLRSLIRKEFRDKNRRVLNLPYLDKETFRIVDIFLNTGQCTELWTREQSFLMQVLGIAARWEIIGLMQLCEDLIKHLIDKDNVLDYLILSKNKSLPSIHQFCKEYINELNPGIKFLSIKSKGYSIQFSAFTDESLDIFKRIKNEVTYASFPGNLLDQESFSEVIRQLPRLLTLDISNSTGYSDRLKDVPSNLPELLIAKCTWLDNEMVKKIAILFPQLRSICLASSSKINYLGWGELKRLPFLRELDISRCFTIRDSDLKIIVQACPKLSKLIMEECTGLTGQTFFLLGKSLPGVSILDISHSSITDDALVDIVTNCKSLAELNLTRCMNLTDKGLMEIAKISFSLKVINLSHCSISQYAIEETKKLRPLLVLCNNSLKF